MSQTATIKSLPRAFRMMKAMQAQGIEWGEDYRFAAADALKGVLSGRMDVAIDRHLAEMAARGEADRRNGSYCRRLMTELGDIELAVPRTRRFSALAVVRAYARRAAHVDRMILACFVLGLSTRKVASALLPILGRQVSAGTVSAVAKSLDAAVAAFHRRPLKDLYPVLMLDGVVLARKTGAGAIRRPVLVALGLRRDGRKEIIDYRLAASESAAEWEALPHRSLPARPRRKPPRRDLRGWRLGPACRAALGLSEYRSPALLGSQDQERPCQGSPGRPGGRQARPACRHERRDLARSSHRRPTLRPDLTYNRRAIFAAAWARVRRSGPLSPGERRRLLGIHLRLAWLVARRVRLRLAVNRRAPACQASSWDVAVLETLAAAFAKAAGLIIAAIEFMLHWRRSARRVAARSAANRGADAGGTAARGPPREAGLLPACAFLAPWQHCRGPPIAAPI